MPSTDNRRCFYSPATHTIIDLINADETSVIDGASLAEVRQRYPDAEVVRFEEAIERKEAAFIRPPEPISAEQFQTALEVMPPAGWASNGLTETFRLGERISAGIARWYCRIGENHYTLADRVALKPGEVVAKCLEASE